MNSNRFCSTCFQPQFMPVKDIILFDLVKEGTLLTSCISIYYWVGGIDLFFQLLLSIRILVKDRI